MRKRKRKIKSHRKTGTVKTMTATVSEDRTFENKVFPLFRVMRVQIRKHTHTQLHTLADKRKKNPINAMVT